MNYLLKKYKAMPKKNCRKSLNAVYTWLETCTVDCNQPDIRKNIRRIYKMRKSILIMITFIFLLLSCNNLSKNNNQIEISKGKSVMKIEEKKADILERINRVPITPLPIGVEHLDSIKELDYNEFGMYNVPINYAIDVNDKFQLNNFLSNSLNLYDYDSNLSSLRISITPVESVKIYFSKRLPPRGNKNFLLCKTIQYKRLDVEPFVGWILLTLANQDVVGWHQIAQSMTSEETYGYALFYIDIDYNIVVNAYATSYYRQSSTARLYAKQYYSLSSEDNTILFDSEEYVETNNNTDDEDYKD
jgi:hypothetical protein